MAEPEQVRATTVVVIVRVFAFAAYFKVVDTIIGAPYRKAIRGIYQAD